MYSFREANDKDYTFLYELNISTMKKYVEQTWGWDDKFQQEYFKSKFSPSKFKIVVVNGKDVGVVSILNNNNEVFIDLIEILPEYQNKGLGTVILKDIIDYAGHYDYVIMLQVLKINPAINFYKRLGFRILSETNTHFVMKYYG